MRARLALLLSAAAIAACGRGEVCAVASDCRSGEVCAQHRCTGPCNDAHDCADGELCRDGACVLPDGGVSPPARDGGVREDAGVRADAGRRDAGPSDGGVVDAGACGPGTHPGGDGSCVPEGTCAAGYALGFLDEDADGAGGAATPDCVSLTSPPPGFAVVGGDCDDADGDAWSLQAFWRDADGDGWTSTQDEVCAGATAPPGYLTARRPPPTASVFGAQASSEENGEFGDEPWSSSSSARKLSSGQFAATISGMSSNELSDYLVVVDHALDVPSTSTVTGIEVHVYRRGTSGALEDVSVRLVVGGQLLGADRARPGAWSSVDEEAVYGGPSDTWGLSPSVADVTSPDFGAALAVRRVPGTLGNAAGAVDFVSVWVFTDDGADCDDGEPTLFLPRTAFVDEDDDDYGADGAPPACLGVPLLPAGFSDRAGDCFDQNAQARPRQSSYFTADRGDGSHDYDCDGAETRQQLARVTSCTQDVDAGTCTQTTASVTEAPCGDPNDVGACDATCTLLSSQRATACR